MTDSLLAVENLTVEIQGDQTTTPVVQNLNFEIPKAKTLGLVGESGSGKSLTALSVLKLLPAAAKIKSGSRIYFQGQDIVRASEVEMRNIRGRGIAMIFQEALTAFNPVLTIGQQIDEVLTSHFSLTRRQRKQKAWLLLEQVGLPEPRRCYQTYPHQLSGGMRQRAMIAMALAGEPKLLLADEPTTALDVTLQAQVLKLIKELQQQYDMSLLFITHNLALVSQMADQVAVMRRGELVEYETAQQFFEKPRDPYSQRLLKALPSVTEKVMREPFPSEIKPLLEVQNLKVYFPIKKGILKRTVGYIKAVDGISFKLQAGRTLALVGESGSGKTTAGLSVIRLIKPTAGSVIFQAHDLSRVKSGRLRKLRRDLQLVFQDPYSSLDPRMQVEDIIAEGLVAQGLLSSRERIAKVCELLQLVGLDVETRHRYPHEFSGGQRQRICIARALALDPKLIVCDEPTSSLDVSVQQQILMLLKRIQQERKIAYLLITHDLGVVNLMADEVAVMRNGCLVEYGSTDEVLTSPQQEYTQRLLKAVPKIK